MKNTIVQSAIVRLRYVNLLSIPKVGKRSYKKEKSIEVYSFENSSRRSSYDTFEYMANPTETGKQDYIFTPHSKLLRA
jgi:hypothetical protein